MAAQVAHAAMAFLTSVLRDSAKPIEDEVGFYEAKMTIDADIFENWINGSFTKTVLKAKNKNQLMKVVKMVEELGWQEGRDYFLIKDNCLTELEPEEDGRCLTCIGFRPMAAEEIDQIGKKFQLY